MLKSLHLIVMMLGPSSLPCATNDEILDWGYILVQRTFYLNTLISRNGMGNISPVDIFRNVLFYENFNFNQKSNTKYKTENC